MATVCYAGVRVFLVKAIVHFDRPPAAPSDRSSVGSQSVSAGMKVTMQKHDDQRDQERRGRRRRSARTAPWRRGRARRAPCRPAASAGRSSGSAPSSRRNAPDRRPTCSATGSSTGTRMVIAAIVSMKQPTISRMMLIRSRMTQRLSETESSARRNAPAPGWRSAARRRSRRRRRRRGPRPSSRSCRRRRAGSAARSACGRRRGRGRAPRRRRRRPPRSGVKAPDRMPPDDDRRRHQRQEGVDGSSSQSIDKRNAWSRG